LNTAVANPPIQPPRHLGACLALALALPLIVALWGAVALWFDAPAAWMAVIVAADADAEARSLETARTLQYMYGDMEVKAGRWIGGKDAGAGARLEVLDLDRPGLAGMLARKMWKGTS
jgi:hypothetical protein